MPCFAKMAVASATVMFALASPASAQQLTISPVTATLEKSEKVAVFSVTNGGTDVVSLQVRPFLWTQPGGVDQLTPTPYIAASPPLANIPPGQTQIIRVQVRQPPIQGETAYRLIIDQLPMALKPGGVIRSGISMVFRYSIPVFVDSGSADAPNVSGVINPDGTLLLSNHGTHHIRVGNPVIEMQSGKLPVMMAGTPYVLAGCERSWRVRGRPGALRGSVTMTAATDTGTLHVTLLPATR
ncbi:MAG: molecular chaperone [Acetobacteraceae bacterium]|nr:molecular chaperone [Acetobacteraceae bacterium]